MKKAQGAAEKERKSLAGSSSKDLMGSRSKDLVARKRGTVRQVAAAVLCREGAAEKEREAWLVAGART